MERNILLDGVMGLVVGDALGLPVQFLTREELKEKPVTQMEGNGTFHMPAGTWSDDSSMALSMLSSIQEKGGFDEENIMEKFVDWYSHGAFTPYGFAFDIGATCGMAICAYARDKDIKTCGKRGERANGNGALMRLMPACIHAYQKEKMTEMSEREAVEWMHKTAALTHNHLRAKMANGIYYFCVKAILDEKGSLLERLQKGMDAAITFYRKDIANYAELAYYGRLQNLENFKAFPEASVKSTGYVVDSLEAAIWCLLTTETFREALLKAVNLGDDTDTVGAIAGGLAALYYGYEAIPEDWLSVIVKREEIEQMCGCQA